MSKKLSQQETERLAELARRMARPDLIGAAVEKVMQWPRVCPGPCFPLVFRAWMSHPAFEVAV